MLARAYSKCDRHVDDDNYALVSNCVRFSRCDRGNPSEFGDTCGDHLLPVDESFTSFRVCENNCEQGKLLDCPLKSEASMLKNVQVSSSSWDQYVLKLYDADPSQLSSLPRISQVDMFYGNMLPIHMRVDEVTYDRCPRSATHNPYRLPQPHVAPAYYFARAEPPTPARNDTWLEVTHCGSSIEDHSLWFFVHRGSGIFVNVGRTIVFRDHPDASDYFGVLGDITHVPAAAAKAGYDSIQYLEHCEGCMCDFELLLTRARGNTACPQGLEFRTGVGASKPCVCQSSRIGSADRKKCITCSSFADMV